jgi:hypothetical protein
MGRGSVTEARIATVATIIALVGLASTARAQTVPPAPQAPTSSGQASFPWGTVGLVGAGAGVVALVVGLYYGAVVAPTKQEESNSTGCGPSTNNCTPLGAAARRDYNLAVTGSTVLLVTGGVLAAAGVTMWLLAPSSASSGAAVSAAPLVAPGVGGIVLNAEWR